MKQNMFILTRHVLHSSRMLTLTEISVNREIVVREEAKNLEKDLSATIATENSIVFKVIISAFSGGGSDE